MVDNTGNELTEEQQFADASRAIEVEPDAEELTETWVDRLMIEGAELAGRLEKLKAFIGSPGYDNLPLPDRELLTAQQTYMARAAPALVGADEGDEEAAKLDPDA